MKCVKDKAGVIHRVENETAQNMVAKQGWSFCSKTEWKATRGKGYVAPAVVVPEKTEKKPKSNKKSKKGKQEVQAVQEVSDKVPEVTPDVPVVPVAVVAIVPETKAKRAKAKKESVASTEEIEVPAKVKTRKGKTVKG